jgi:hypothetical protein
MSNFHIFFSYEKHALSQPVHAHKLQIEINAQGHV